MNRYNPEIHNRRSIRLQGYDYSTTGAYFVTICIQNRECLFGEIPLSHTCPEIELNEAGQMIQRVWDEIPEHYPGINTDGFVIMPNHIHGIITVGDGPRACPDDSNAIPIKNRDFHNDVVGCNGEKGHPRGGAPTNEYNDNLVLSLSDVVHRFKTLTTKRYADGVKKSGWQPFPGKLWQRNFWEHIIRNEKEEKRIKEYIRNNPAQWESDKLYPENGTKLKEVLSSYGEEPWMV